MLLGDDILVWMVLAFGGALAAGNAFALVRPPKKAAGGDDMLDRPPLARTAVMILVGTVAAIWAVASLASG